MQLRITSGELKNKRLEVPKSARPVKERVKLSVFSILEDRILGKNILDLFAGTGNLGFESLSRGAKRCTFVDDDYDAIGALRRNAKSLNTKDFNVEDKITIEKSDATKFIANHHEYYDIIFIDPPYATHIIHILKYIHDSINKNGIIIYFHSSDYTYNIKEINPKLKITEKRKYGITTVDFIEPCI